MVNPFGIVNDGLSECVLLTSEAGVMKAISLFEEQKNGGSHGYSKTILTYRHKEAKIYNKNTLNGVSIPQLFNIDGEDLEVWDFVKY